MDCDFSQLQAGRYVKMSATLFVSELLRLKLDKIYRIVEYFSVVMRIFGKFIKLLLALLMAFAPLQFAHSAGSVACADMDKLVYQQDGGAVVSIAMTLAGDSKLLSDAKQQNCRTGGHHNCASCAPCAAAPIALGADFNGGEALGLPAIQRVHVAYLSPSLRPPISRS